VQRVSFSASSGGVIVPIATVACARASRPAADPPSIAAAGPARPSPRAEARTKIRNIAISASLAKLFRGGKLCPSFNAKDLWTHSTAVAATSKLIADELGLSCPDEAFLAGLMHDIGIIVEMQSDRDALTTVVSTVAGADGIPTSDMLKIENEVFGANHQQFGEALCEKWKFPRVFALVAGNHHSPMGVDAELRTLPLVVHVADKITAEIEDGGFRLDVLNTEIDPAILDELKITSDGLIKIKEVIPQHIEEVRSLLST